MGHTKGPWAISKHGNDYGIYAEHQQAFTLALVRDTGDGEVYANAALLAAAPALLAALQDLLHVHGCSHDCAVCDEARAAIARAKGGQ